MPVARGSRAASPPTIRAMSTTRAELRPRRRRTSVLQVVGEIVLTIGVLCGLFVVWQIFINNEVSGTLQHAASESLSKKWATETPTPADTSTADPTIPVIAKKPA